MSKQPTNDSSQDLQSFPAPAEDSAWETVVKSSDFFTYAFLSAFVCVRFEAASSLVVSWKVEVHHGKFLVDSMFMISVNILKFKTRTKNIRLPQSLHTLCTTTFLCASLYPCALVWGSSWRSTVYAVTTSRLPIFVYHVSHPWPCVVRVGLSSHAQYALKSTRLVFSAWAAKLAPLCLSLMCKCYGIVEFALRDFGLRYHTACDYNKMDLSMSYNSCKQCDMQSYRP